jgi:hypothetical protein
VSAGETDTFSVVVKYPATRTAGSLPVRVYVAFAETSAPVAGADVRLEIKGASEATHELKKTAFPGVYEASIPAPPDGSHAGGIASVQTKDAFDLVVLGELSFGPMDPAPASSKEDHFEPSIGHMAGGAAALAIVAGGIGFAAGRRWRRRAPPGHQDQSRKPASAEVIS